MPEETIEITIAPDGAVQVHVKGVRGKGCLKASEAIERELGRVKGRTHTREYAEAPPNSRQVRQG